MELSRKEVIEELERFRLDSVYKSNKEKKIDICLDYAISSLKTDEAYQLMYEGVETYDKDKVIKMFRELQLEIGKLDSRAGYDGYGMPTFSTDYIRKKKVNEIIQQRINAMRGKEE